MQRIPLQPTAHQRARSPSFRLGAATAMLVAFISLIRFAWGNSGHAGSTRGMLGSSDSDVYQLVQRALHHASLDAPPGWQKRARWRGMLPRLLVRVLHGRGYTSDIDLRANAPPGIDANHRATWTAEVRVSWDLSRIVFDRDEIAAAEAARREDNARWRLRERVIQLFYRRLALLDQLNTKGSDSERHAQLPERRIQLLTELRITEALLHELSGGAFFSRSRPRIE